jgi:hypothetical protein
MRIPRTPIEGMTVDELELCVDYIVAVDFGKREWWARGRELKERGITIDDALENESGHVSEIIQKFGLGDYETLRSIVWNWVLTRNDQVARRGTGGGAKEREFSE